jgi:O-antigen ligase
MNGPPRRPISVFELLVLFQVAVFMVAATWLFGGNAEWVRPYLAAWGSLGMVLTLSGGLMEPRRPGTGKVLLCLWPFALFNALVAASCLVPGFREIHRGIDAFYTPEARPAWLPSSAVPAAALRALWLFDGTYLSCFNLALVIRRRRAIRGLLVLAVLNALVLSVFGTVQKLSGAAGMYFGAVPSVQTYFFASFIYHNHWGSFVVLMAAACLGLVGRYAGRIQGRDFLHSPGLAGLVAVLLMAATAPLSGSRSCTVLMVLLLGGAFIGWIARLLGRRRRLNESAAPALIAAVAAVAAALAGIWFVARDSIETRLAVTESQIAAMRAQNSMGSRATLYADTWRMARDRPLFGWGMGSFPYVFFIYNSQDHPNRIDHLPNNYHDAHNDWLQSAAEHGLIGSTVLALCALVPLRLLRGRAGAGPLTRYLLAGCALILAYAWIEFPFGNVAVVLAWWFCFFTALAYALLSAPDSKSPASDFPGN